MPVVYGDKIAESVKLNRRSAEAQDFFVALVGRPVPDHFGRFRLSASHVSLRLYPKREVSRAIRNRIERLLQELGTGVDETDVLWRTWEHDGVRFAEMTAWKASGNAWHRTPEPPWSEHIHTAPCLPSAIARAREWGFLEESRFLSRLLIDLRSRSRGGDPPSVPSVPIVPSVPEQPSSTRAREAETAPADDDGCGRPPATAPDDPCSSYVSAVLDLYGQLPGTRAEPSPTDRETATRLWERGIPIECARAGLLMAAVRRELRKHEEPLTPIGSLKYFLGAIEEARASPPDSGHVAYLASKLAPYMKPNGGPNGTLDGS